MERLAMVILWTGQAVSPIASRVPGAQLATATTEEWLQRLPSNETHVCEGRLRSFRERKKEKVKRSDDQSPCPVRTLQQGLMLSVLLVLFRL